MREEILFLFLRKFIFLVRDVCWQEEKQTEKKLLFD
jgi:hypothetical protein